MEQEIREHADKWSRVKALLDAGASIADIIQKEPWLKTRAESPPAAEIPASGSSDPLNPAVLALLEKATGLGSAEAWRNIWLLVSKGEHDNEDPKKAFADDRGDNLFVYSSALSYDWKERGVTMGLVGWTTACDGKEGRGDAPSLFGIYKQLGGDDLNPYCKGTTSSKNACRKLIKKIKSLEGDARWVQAQWQQLVTKSDDGAYIYHTIETFKKIGIQKPSALAIATVFDASLNQGFDGKDGGTVNLEKLAVHGNENATLEKYNAWRRKVAGTNDYNSPECNGINRADQFEKLRKAGAFALTGNEAAKAIKDAISWQMK